MRLSLNYAHLLPLLLANVALSYGKEINSVDLSNPSVMAAPGSDSFPHQGWVASIDWSISDTSGINADDYFAITMPRVYKVKFNEGDTSFAVSTKDGTEVFQCFAPQQASFKYQDTILKCHALTDLSVFGSISGSLTTTLVLSNGGSAYPNEMANSEYFSAGQNTLYFNDLEATINANAKSESDDFYFSGRSTAYKSLESYFLGFNCPNGHVVSASQYIEYDLSLIHI